MVNPCIACCPACKPRYQRLVDAIYPRGHTIGEGLNISNMHKLTFYAMSHPEKLDRIGYYIVQRLSRDLYRMRMAQVEASVEAMDQLLQTCHGSPSLNVFVDSFLRMVQKLLETNVEKLEILATNSFVNFGNIEEDTPSYHRQYDFFICKFASMCHRRSDGPVEQDLLIRFAGLRGLRGVIWKSMSDDMQANIWEKPHMDKIVPSILYNLHDVPSDDSDTAPHALSDAEKKRLFVTSADANGENPQSLADQCLRELMGKASFASLHNVIEPVLQHCDLHHLWNPPAETAVETFRAIIFSIQQQNSYFVIQELVNHLDHKATADANVRIGIAITLCAIVSIAGTSIGPLLLGIFSSLLKHLRASVDFQQSKRCPSVEQEKIYQETLINAMGDFANALPDYQKVEIMMFTLGNIPKLSATSVKSSGAGDTFLQHVLLKTLLKVATKYKTAYLATVFIPSFLGTLLQLAVVVDIQVRLITFRILHTLLDRHDNLSKLQRLTYVEDVATLNLTVEKCSRADQMFMRKNMHSITIMLYRNATSINSLKDDEIDNQLNAVLCTIALLCVEVGYDEMLIELFRLVVGIQTAALDTAHYNLRAQIALHNLVAKYLNLSSQLLANPSLCLHVHQVMKNRAQRSHPALNLFARSTDPGQNVPTVTEFVNVADDPGLLFDQAAIADALKASGKDTSRLCIPFVVRGVTGESASAQGSPSHRSESEHAIASDFPAGYFTEEATTDFGSTILHSDEDSSSIDSTGVSRRSTAYTINADGSNLPITLESLRILVHQPPDTTVEEKRELDRCRELNTMFRSNKIGELVAMVNKDGCATDLSSSIQRILKQHDEKIAESMDSAQKQKPVTIFDLKLPDSFIF